MSRVHGIQLEEGREHMSDQGDFMRTPEAVTFQLPPLVEWKCPKGHTWTLRDNPAGTFVSFHDHNGQMVRCNVCPFCLIEFFTAQGMMMEKHAITEELVPDHHQPLDMAVEGD